MFSQTSNLRQYSVDYKMETYLKIAQLYLEDEDPVQAEAYINRASLLQTDTKTEKLQILYKVHADSSNFKQCIRVARKQIDNMFLLSSSYTCKVHQDEIECWLRILANL